jgi:hypothetical protein
MFTSAVRLLLVYDVLSQSVLAVLLRIALGR